MEGKLSTVIHSQAGKLAVQHQAFVTLQARLQRQLGEYQQKCMMQQQEITHLRRLALDGAYVFGVTLGCLFSVLPPRPHPLWRDAHEVMRRSWLSLDVAIPENAATLRKVRSKCEIVSTLLAV